MRDSGGHENSNNGKLKYKRGSSLPDDEDDDDAEKPLPLQHRCVLYVLC